MVNLVLQRNFIIFFENGGPVELLRSENQLHIARGGGGYEKNVGGCSRCGLRSHRKSVSF